ncbi:hypothetical protein Ancab_029309 [Ancistrocladus abbreviatus]
MAVVLLRSGPPNTGRWLDRIIVLELGVCLARLELLFFSSMTTRGKDQGVFIASRTNLTSIIVEITTMVKLVTKERRVVVTGMGVFYKNLLAGVSGVSEIESFDSSGFPTRIGAEVKSFSTDRWVPSKLSEQADRYIFFVVTAGKKALDYAGVIEDVMAEMDKSR